MTSLVLVVLGFVALVLESALAALLPLHGFAPNLMLPLALFLGVAAEVHILRGVLTSFVLGCLLDSFSGSPVGLQTLVLTASFLIARLGGVRLLAQGPVVQILLCFLITIAFGAAVLMVLAFFKQAVGDGFELSADQVSAIVRGAVATGLCSPLVFAAATRIEALGTFKREKRTLAR